MLNSIFLLNKKALSRNNSVFIYNHGRGGENRTPIKSFGDSYATIIPHPCGRIDYSIVLFIFQEKTHIFYWWYRC